MTKARELGTPVVPMTLKHRINPFVSFRIWLFCRRNRVDLIKSYSSKDHWLCLPLFLCGWPVTRARCITDPLGKKNRAFIYRHGCAKIVADAQIIKKEFIEQYGIAPEKIEVIGSAVDLTKFSPTRDPMKFRREVGLSAETPIIANIGMIRPDKASSIWSKPRESSFIKGPMHASFLSAKQLAGGAGRNGSAALSTAPVSTAMS